MISTRPRITFDHRGYCNACQWKIKRKNQLEKREQEFIELSKQLRSKK